MDLPIPTPGRRPGRLPAGRCRESLAAFLALAAASLIPVLAHAGRISEPETVIYGRVMERAGLREFPLTRGELVWIVQSSAPGSPEVRLTAKLRPLAGGRFSYQLRIPHEVLAYDLRVRPGALGLTAAPTRILHRGVTLDGQPLAFTPGAIDGLSASQSARAGTFRVDLERSGTSPDTDGDGAPDWWEDQQGLDRFDPSDASPAEVTQSGPGGGTSGGTASPAATAARTFAEWRAAWFPDASGDLDRFGAEDADQDGIANFLEYAFDLDPTQAGADAVASLPRAFTEGGRRGLAFSPRQGATDLEYRVEISDDLLGWQDAGPEMEPVSTASTDSARSAFVLRAGSDDAPRRFFRVLVNRR